MGEGKLGRPKVIAGEPTAVSTWVSPPTAKAIADAARQSDRSTSAVVRDVLDRVFLQVKGK